jgi:hypothetical protein
MNLCNIKTSISLFICFYVIVTDFYVVLALMSLFVHVLGVKLQMQVLNIFRLEKCSQLSRPISVHSAHFIVNCMLSDGERQGKGE